MYKNKFGVVIEGVNAADPMWVEKIKDGDVILCPDEPKPVVKECKGSTCEIETPKEDIKAVRKQYEEKLGKKPFAGWDIDKLKEKLSEAE